MNSLFNSNTRFCCCYLYNNYSFIKFHNLCAVGLKKSAANSPNAIFQAETPQIPEKMLKMQVFYLIILCPKSKNA